MCVCVQENIILLSWKNIVPGFCVITGLFKNLDWICTHSHTHEGTGQPSCLWADTTLLTSCDVGN